MSRLTGRLRRLRDDPELRSWLPAALVGALVGGCGVAWLFWGWPHLLRDGVCFVFWLGAGAAALALCCGMGVSLVILTQWLLKALRRLRPPPAYAMWEPVDPVPEIDMGVLSEPGCAVALYLPLIVMTGAFALGCVVLALRQVSVGRVIAMVVLSLPVGVAMARSETRRRRRAEQQIGR